ncbi:MAG: pyridoxamine 5'-phosphate oxidase family protein [Deltaproteobacteria bacterium]|nr:MAG: pyridoxamine 5'-phosphate oxidase family protein [Deltaproteobacteria bacterium]
MRRKDRQTRDVAAIAEIIRDSLVCRLALSEDNSPYVVPLCFGYEENTLYFHSSLEGKKIDILKKNGNVCFEFDIDHHVVKDERACKWSMKYRSVIGFGKASFVQDPEEKMKGLNAIMKQYSGRSFDYPESALEATAIIKVEIESMTGKQNGYQA